MVLKRILVFWIISCLSCCIHAFVIRNVQDYCAIVNSDKVSCKHLFFDSFEEVEFDINKKLNASQLEFKDSQFRTIPKNAFRISKPVVKFTMENCGLQEIYRYNFDSGVNNTSTAELHLTNNFIERIPSRAFELLPKLRYLQLSRNNLTTLDPDCFVGSDNVASLYINSNNIRTLWNDVMNPLKSLQVLQLSDNKLESLPRNIFMNNKNLLYVNLIGNNLKIVDVNVLKSPLALQYVLQHFNESLEATNIEVFNNPYVREIHLSRNFVPYISRHSFPMATILRMFNAEHCQLTVVERGAFSGQNDLQYLALRGNLLKSFDLTQLSTMRKLETINLSSNLLTEFNFRLLEDNKALKRVELAGNQFPCELNNEILKYFKNKNITIDLKELKCGKA